MNGHDLVKEWFQFAHNDLIVAKHSFEDLYPRQIDISCYHCQQSAEKALKGYLFFQGIEPPRIHNLRVLCQMCIQLDDSFKTLLDFCSDLTPYGVEARYPNELETDEAVARLAIEKADEIYNFCFSKIPWETEAGNENSTEEKT
jgi:HEPN domain-containing protein